MNALPDKPSGSVITASVDAEGMTLKWPPPSVGLARYGVAAFLAIWLCGWAAGWWAAANLIMQGNGSLFLIAWVGGWTVGGGFAAWHLWIMLRPDRPESVRLEASKLRYDPGRSPRPLSRHGRHWTLDEFPAPSPAADVARDEIERFVLDRVGNRQRLYFDRGADRIEFGAGLREPEREWLFKVLQRWHEATGDAGPAPAPCGYRSSGSVASPN